MSLIQRITALTAAMYGVNILDLDPPAGVRAATSRVVAIVGDFPWGPTNEVTDVSSVGEFFTTFAPPAFGNTDDYPALKALLNKRFGRLKVCRIAADSAAVAERTFVDGEIEPGDSVTVTARYPGASGNLVKIAWSANATTAANRDMTVSIGTRYQVTYPNVVVAGAELVINDPGDPFVTVAEAEGGDGEVPAVVAATALEDGDDGEAVAGDYVGSDVSDVGIRRFYGEAVDVGVLFVAECPAALADAVNTGLRAYAIDTQKGLAILCSPEGQTKATAETYTASYAHDRAVYAWPRVRTTNGYSPNLEPVEVDGNAFIAAAIIQTDPWVSPGGPGRAGLFRGVLGLVDDSATKDDLEALRAGGVCVLASVRGVGVIVRGAVTTSQEAGKERIYRRRMVDYIMDALAERWARNTEDPLDIDLVGESLGPVTGAQIGDAAAFLTGLWQQERGIATVNGAAGFELDPFSLNTQGDIDVGTWTTKVSVKLTSLQERVILAANIAETVNFTEAA